MKRYFGGTYRAVDPADTWKRVWRSRSTFGITRLARVTGLDFVGIPGFTAIRPNSKSLAVSQGKGLSDDAARASAIMESVELWHAENANLVTRTTSFETLSRTGRVIDVNRLPLRPGVQKVDETQEIAWVEGTNVIDAQNMWVPLDAVIIDSTLPAPPVFPHSTNGLASGNTHDEAACHALFELIERDAYSMWQHDLADPEGESTLLDLRTVDDPDCRALLNLFAEAGLVVVVNDITSEFGVPCYTCLVGDQPGNYRTIGLEWGAGCHLSPRVALARALTEAAQSRLTVISGNRDDIADSRYTDLTDDDLTDFRDRVQSAVPTCQWRMEVDCTSSFTTDFKTVVSRLSSAGIDAVVLVTLTDPDIGIPVVKAIATDLEGPFGHVRINSRARTLTS
ncbi:YcaO-like family protein [Microlunatus sp. GCM10028923]|uniref:YcaO-like family protein n=1 Tax=Microlunatus sp. GCM10028923 TaxID=3273400 RepID=UPI003620F9F5